MIRRRISTNIDYRLIGSLREISFFVLLVLSSVLCISTIAHFQSQFDSSPPTALYKEIAEDYHPSAVCDREGAIHVVWQSDRGGNWDICHTLIEDRHKKEFERLTTSPHDDMSPSLAEDERGNIWVVWVRSDSLRSSIYGRILDYQTSTWGEEKELRSINKKERKFENKKEFVACELKSPSLISIDSENMLLAWISREGENYEIEYVVHGSPELSKIESSETETLSLNSNNSLKVVLGKTDAGKIFALFDLMPTAKSEIYYSMFDEESRNFDYLPKQLTYNEDNKNKLFIGDTPSVVIRSGKPSLLFYHSEDWDIFSSVEETGDASGFPKFSPPIKFSKTTALEDCPVALEASDGEIYLFWASDYTGDNEIYFCHGANQDDFGEEKVFYERGPETIDEEKKRFVKNLTMDPNKNNAPPEGSFCKDIFLSTAVIGEELWVVWDSYQWDLTESNNRRQIRYTKMSDEDGIDWKQPITVVDSRESKEDGRDDRHPTLVGTKDRIWLFWHSDRYLAGENYEICYIYCEDGEWKWKNGENDRDGYKDPFRLTESPARDTLPIASSAGDRIFIVWICEEESGSSNIFFCEFDGKECLRVLPLADEGTPRPKWNPSIAAYRGWHLTSLGYTEKLMIAWESIAEGYFVCQFKTVNISENIFDQNEFSLDDIWIKKQQGTDFHYPCMSYISRHPILKKVLPNESWCIWQYSESGCRESNIQCKNRSGEIQVTDDLSFNGRPQIVEFKGKVWIFWDSGGGNERGIYFKCLYRKEIPLWLTIYSYVLALCWVLYFWDVRSRGGVRKLMMTFSMWIDELFHEHVGLRDVIIGVAASLLTYILLHFLGTFLNYLAG